MSDDRDKLLGIMILFFMLFGSVFGIFEELVALVPIVIILAYALGWDSLTGLGMSLLATGFGFASATLNPFTLGVAQEVAGLPTFSGVGFRIVVFIIMYSILYGFLYRYTKKIEKDPTKSFVYEDDLKQREKYANITAIEKLPNEQYLGKTVKIFGASLVLVISYIVAGFFIPALSAVSGTSTIV